jgi:hypothetical protein
MLPYLQFIHAGPAQERILFPKIPIQGSPCKKSFLHRLVRRSRLPRLITLAAALFGRLDINPDVAVMVGNTLTHENVILQHIANLNQPRRSS